MKYKYDHFGVPVRKKQKGMTYFPEFKVWSSDFEKDPYRIEWLFFEKECEMHPLIQAIPHVCYLVKDIRKAVQGKKVLLKPLYQPGYYMAFIEEKGIPIEFMQLSKKP